MYDEVGSAEAYELWQGRAEFPSGAQDFAAVESKVEEQAEAAWSEALKNQLAAKKHRQLLGSPGRL